jgi:hypothetical protein
MVRGIFLFCVFTCSCIFAEMGYGGTADAGAVKSKTFLPKESAVLFSSRWKHPNNAQDAYDSFTAAASFHATGFWWVYSLDKKWIADIKQRGYTFQGSLNTILTDAPDLKTRDKGRIVNAKGEKVTAPWMTWGGSWWGCVNSPEYRTTFLNHAKVLIDARADMLQMDDPKMNLALLNQGACHCRYCVKKAEAAGRKVEDIQKESVDEFFTVMRAEINRYAKRNVFFSCNNYGGDADFPFNHFDYGLAELSEKKASPEYIYDAIRTIRALGKGQAFTFVSTDAAFTRRVIASSYASGGHCIVPWDVYIPPNQPRYFGKAEEYADLYGFVRAIAAYLDGYEDVCTRIRGRNDDRFAINPVHISDSKKDVAVYLRSAKGKTKSSVAVHLVSWNKDVKTIQLSIDKSILPDGALRIRLMKPVPYNEQMNKNAEDQKKYSALAAAAEVKGDISKGISVQLNNPWTVIVIDKK